MPHLSKEMYGTCRYLFYGERACVMELVKLQPVSETALTLAV